MAAQFQASLVNNGFHVQGLFPLASTILNKIEWSDEVKLVVFVPSAMAEQVRKILGENGDAGKIGNYSHCTFSTKGIGRCNEIKNGQIGDYQTVNHAEEERIETVVKITNLSKVLRKVLAVHPYKEVGFDVMPLLSRTSILSSL